MGKNKLTNFLFLEMVARCIKNDLREKMRKKMEKKKMITNYPIIHCIVKMLNQIFTFYDPSLKNEYWCSHLPKKLYERFELSDKTWCDMPPNQFIQDRVFSFTQNNPIFPSCPMDARYYILMRIQKMTGNPSPSFLFPFLKKLLIFLIKIFYTLIFHNHLISELFYFQQLLKINLL